MKLGNASFDSNFNRTALSLTRPSAKVALWSIGIGYVLCLHAVLGVLIFKTDFLHLAGKTLGWIPPEEWSLPLCFDILKQAEQDASVPAGSVLLLGDSIIMRLNAKQIAEGTVNFGIGGDTTQTLTSRLAVLRSVAQSRIVVVGVGVNDLKYRPVEQIARDYARLLDRLGMASRVMVLSVLPVDNAGEAARRRPYLRNDSIRTLDQDLRALCQMRTNCRYLDAWPAMAASGSAVYADDGWHLSITGNRILEGFLRTSLMSP